jgi:hypothetical protein
MVAAVTRVDAKEEIAFYVFQLELSCAMAAQVGWWQIWSNLGKHV